VFTPADEHSPRGQISPLGMNLAPRGEVKNGPLCDQKSFAKRQKCYYIKLRNIEPYIHRRNFHTIHICNAFIIEDLTEELPTKIWFFLVVFNTFFPNDENLPSLVTLCMYLEATTALAV
jgi:hypothetical protein